MNPFWKDVLEKGAIMGIIMAVSKIYESHVISGGSGIGTLTLMSLEFVVATILYITMMVVYARRFARKTMEEMESPKYFNFSTGWTWTVMAALLAGVIVGIVSYIDVNGVIGYDQYVEGTVRTMKTSFSEAKVPSSMEQTMSRMVRQMRDIEKPTLLKTVLASSGSYMLCGALLGIIIGAVLQKSPSMTEEDDDE